MANDPTDAQTRREIREDIAAMRTASPEGVENIRRAMIGLGRWCPEAALVYEQRKVRGGDQT